MTTSLDDGRISKFHRQIYNWCKELYPSFKIEVEKLIPSTNQRIDIYIHQLDLAIECDGTFHDKPSFFFVKSVEAWKDIRMRDKLKTKTLNSHNINLIRIPYNCKIKNAEDLESLISEYFKKQEEYSEANLDVFKDSYKEREKGIREEYKEKDKERNKESYTSYKESDYYKEQREKARKHRKEQYRKYKENKRGA